MNTNIYQHQFRSRLKSVVIWSVSVAFIVVFYLSLYPVFSDQAAMMNEFLARYPVQLRAAFGLDKIDLSTVLGFYAFTFVFVQLFREGRAYPQGTLLLLLLSLVIFQLVFLGIGLVVSLLVRRVRSVTPYAVGLAFGTYILNGFSGIFGDVKLELITPFKHLDPTYIVQQASYNTPLVILDTAVILVTLGVSYWLYTRRDTPAVAEG